MLLRTRRFYSAFYQWTLLTSNAPTCARHPIHSRCLSGDKRRNVNEKSEQERPLVHLHIPKLPPRSNDAQTGMPIKRAPGRGTYRFRPHPRPQEPEDNSWLRAEAVSSDQQPFDTLDAWQEAVRYNAFAGIILQIALPIGTVARLRKRHGSLEEIISKFGAKLEEGQISTHTGADGNRVDLQAALLSGTHDEVKALRSALRHLRADEAHDRPSPKANRHPSEQVENIKLGSFFKRFADIDVDETLAATLEPSFDPESAANPEELLASDKFSVWECRLRLKSSSSTVVAFTAPSTQWGWITRTIDFKLLRKHHAIRVFERTAGPGYARVSLKGKSVDNISSVLKLIGIARAQSIKRSGNMDKFSFGRDSPAVSLSDRELEGPRPRECVVGEISTKDVPSTVSPTREETPEDTRDPQLLLEDMKQCLRPLTHPVAVVTSVQHFDIESREQGGFLEAMLQASRGVTVSSLTAVSFNPDPIISFNLKLPSRTWTAIKSSKIFDVHLPDASPLGAAVAHMFTQSYDDPSEPFRTARRLQGLSIVHSWPSKKRRWIRLTGKAIMTSLSVELMADCCTRAADHIIVIGKVRRISLQRTSSAGERQIEGPPQGLAYAMQGYRGVGEEIKPADLEKVVSNTLEKHGQEADIQIAPDKTATEAGDETKVTTAAEQLRSSSSATADNEATEEDLTGSPRMAQSSQEEELALRDLAEDGLDGQSSQSPPAADEHHDESSEHNINRYFEQMSRLPEDVVQMGGDPSTDSSLEGREVRAEGSNVDLQEVPVDAEQSQREDGGLDGRRRSRGEETDNATDAGHHAPETEGTHSPSDPAKRGTIGAWGL